MSKNYFSSKTIKFIAAISVCLGLVFLNPRHLFDPVRMVIVEAAYPFQKVLYLVSEKTGSFLSLVSSITDLKKDNEALIRENGILSVKLAELENEKKENEDLRRQLQLAPFKDYELQAMSIIAQDSHGLGSWLMADRGSRDGIRVGMPVVVYEGILIGKISEVYADSCKISLLNDASSSVNVVDLATGAKGILTGEYGLGLTMDMVEQTEVLNVGDDILTSGLGGVIPKGFLIGKVTQVKNSPDKLFQQALVIPKVKYADLDTVFAVKN